MGYILIGFEPAQARKKPDRVTGAAFFGCVGLRGFVPVPGQTRWFAVRISASEQAVRQNPDKEQLREAILRMSASGMSYREIGVALGIHWTRVG